LEKIKKSKRKKVRKENEKIVKDVNSLFENRFVFLKKKNILNLKAASVLVFFAGLAATFFWMAYLNVQTTSKAEEMEKNSLIEVMKKRGCVADGLFSGYGGDTNNAIALINRSQCLYLHRSIETWLVPPNFNQIQAEIQKISKPNMITGMFLAEAINKKAVYFYPDENRSFNFTLMCREGSDDYWGKETCKPDFGSAEYRKYLKYITQKSIDLGVRSFLIGQIYFQENIAHSYAKEIVSEMRKYAKAKNKVIIIGAQTNNIENERYLKNFDYIEGGVGIKEAGEIENGPCFSKRGGCWALLWNNKFAKKANNVFLHLDWSGFQDDDMSLFSLMDQATREKTLRKLYAYFTSKDMGFMMPYLAVVNKDINGCKGPTREFYSPDNLYSCRDENAIDKIFKSGGINNNAQFISQSVPKSMLAGKKYQISMVFKNTGAASWSAGENYRLGSQNPQDNGIWGGRIDMNNGQTIDSAQTMEFSFFVLAPEVPGTYDFQWRMVQEGIEWFGDKTPNVVVNVTSQ